MARSDAEIEQLIDERARAIIAEEKAEAARAEGEAKLAAERAESEARLRARHDELKASVEKLRFDLARNRRWQVEPWPMSRARAILYFILACLFGLVVHYVAFPILHWTPASLACPALCEGCEPSMRQLYEVSGYGSTCTVSNYTYVCRSSKVDIDGASVSDVEGARKEELAPYRVNGLLVALIETVFGLFFLVPYLRRRVKLAEKREEGELAARLADAETELRAAYRGRADESGAAPYR